MFIDLFYGGISIMLVVIIYFCVHCFIHLHDILIHCTEESILVSKKLTPSKLFRYQILPLSNVIGDTHQLLLTSFLTRNRSTMNPFIFYCFLQLILGTSIPSQIRGPFSLNVASSIFCLFTPVVFLC